MLEFRRIIEFSSRVHTYLLAMYFFFVLVFTLFLYFPIQDNLVSFNSISQMVMGWTIFLEGVWILFASVFCSLYTRVVVVKPVVLTIARIVIYFLISIFVDLLNTMITNGFSFGG
mgnify:FL=1